MQLFLRESARDVTVPGTSNPDFKGKKRASAAVGNLFISSREQKNEDCVGGNLYGDLVAPRIVGVLRRHDTESFLRQRIFLATLRSVPAVVAELMPSLRLLSIQRGASGGNAVFSTARVQRNADGRRSVFRFLAKQENRGAWK